MHQATAPSIAVVLVLCLLAANRARVRGAVNEESSPTASGSRRRRRKKNGVGMSGGFVELIREDFEVNHRREIAQPSLSREQLSEGRLVVVIIGPASTRVHQSYVLHKLLRYLRWSNLTRRHFRISDSEERLEPSSDSTNDPTDSEESSGSDGEKALAGQIATTVAPSTVKPDRNGSLGNGNKHGSGSGHCTGDTNGGAPGNMAHTTGYNFSDRGKAAALTTIAVQDSAKKVATWLGGLKAGGVAVVEAGRSEWGNTRHGRETLPSFLRQNTAPGLGILWVEVLPSGLYHRVEPPLPQQQQPQQRPLRTTGSLNRAPAGADAGNGAAWKSTNGPFAARGAPHAVLGGNVVETFLQSGNLVGAGGRVIYESVRRGTGRARGVVAARGAGAAAAGDGSIGSCGGKICFVSLADQGLNVQSQLEHEACPLIRRVGTFAAALRMKKSWHGCPVYLTRHGESLGNQSKSMGGNGRLSEKGDRYAGVLADFVAAQPDAGQSRLLVWCSPMKRAAQTARAVKCHRYTQWEALTELDTGIFNGFSYKQVERDHPEEFAARELDKLRYRYPEGEGYLDVVNRLDPVVVALEKEDGPVLIVSHQAVLRCLYAYFHDISLREMPRIPISLHTVVKLTPVDFPEAAAPRFWKELRFELIKQTPLEQLAGVATINGGKNRQASQLGESLS